MSEMLVFRSFNDQVDRPKAPAGFISVDICMITSVSYKCGNFITQIAEDNQLKVSNFYQRKSNKSDGNKHGSVQLCSKSFAHL